MKSRILSISAFLFCITNLFAQSITGNFKSLVNQEITLQGFNGLQNYVISTTKLDEKGNLKLTYSTADYGMGYLISTDQKIFLLVLSGEDIELIGEAISDPKSITFTKGQENQWFEQYANEHPKREQALSAWEYLDKIYTQEVLFAGQKAPNKAIQLERKRINDEDAAFLNSLPKESYCRWFLPMRKLVSSVSVVAQYRTAEIPATIAAFRTIDYTDKRLYKSGLFKDAIESHFWLLENSGKPLDSVFIEMQQSIDAIMVGLVKDEKRLNEVSDNLFNFLEQHSLFNASEYLAIKLLTQNSCVINEGLSKQLESYIAMKKGNTAPNIVFPKSIIYPTADFKPTQLSDIKSKYTLVVFGASWCPKCKEEIPEIAKYYQDWKKNGVEVLLVSLDDNDMDFINFASAFPFISVCDHQKWNSPIAQSYYVFSTPTMYLLDKEQKIILRLNSVKQMESWVDWNLVKGNNTN
jgi:thiol-disulfide isomerase/thioredoxin